MDWSQRWARKLFHGEREADGAPPQRRAGQFLLLAAAGVLLLLLSRLTPQEPVQRPIPGPAPATAAAGDGADDLERRLEQWLGSMYGAGRVEVMITFDTAETQVYAMERTLERTLREEPGEGGEARYVTTEERIVERPAVIRTDQGRSEAPLTITTRMPDIRGVVVTAEGARDPKVRYEIFQAVQSALGVPAHKVHVFAKE